ncbi:MAG: BatA domain-containing protein [Kiritimatiellae bacterium]|nr:BatA domain-containing protein [Kiritimatiellia bacterium]
MIFLQPELLWGLLAAPLPIVIHWLNRLRYRRMPWAATAFLRIATRTSTRRSRIRQWLILACRVTALTALLLLLTRPLAGGRFGAMLAGPPDLVVIALDRSASMELSMGDSGRTRRVAALETIARSPRELWRQTRFVLLDSATLLPQTIAEPAVLPELAAAAPTDAGADLPALLGAAAKALALERPGRAELWVLSDLQASSWRLEDPRWRVVAASLAALPQDVTVRLFASRGAPSANRTLRWVGVRRVAVSGRWRVDVVVAIRAEGAAANQPVMLSWNAMGVRSAAEVRPGPSFSTIQRSFEWPVDQPVFWGTVELPPDAAPVDDQVYFAVAKPAESRAVIVAEHDECERRLRWALAPLETGHVEVVRARAGSVAAALTGRVALVVIQGTELSEADIAAIRRVVAEGSSALWMPGTEAGHRRGDWTWGTLESAPEHPWRVAAWNRRDGPLRDGSDGQPIPVERLAVSHRRVPTTQPLEDAIHAVMGDGVPLLVGRVCEAGRTYALGTLPLTEWSTLAEGWVWVPMLQRMLEEGARRWEAADTLQCGQWPAFADGDWRPIEGSSSSRPGYGAGIFRRGGRMIALNRPPEEDEAEEVRPDSIRQKLSPVRTVFAGDTTAHAGEETARAEISAALAVLAMLALLAESWLLGSEHRPALP